MLERTEMRQQPAPAAALFHAAFERYLIVVTGRGYIGSQTLGEAQEQMHSLHNAAAAEYMKLHQGTDFLAARKAIRQMANDCFMYRSNDFYGLKTR